jgi:transposase
MARVGVTLKLLHGEYADSCAAAGEPMTGYDRFCRTYQRHVSVTGAAYRVGDKAGQTVEVDWSWPTMQLADPVTGKARTVYLCVACLPFSRYAFVEPALDIKQDTWLRVHVAMFEAFTGSAPRIVPDNLKTGDSRETGVPVRAAGNDRLAAQRGPQRGQMYRGPAHAG